MSESQSTKPARPEETGGRYESLYKRFDDAWQRGEEPRLDDYLPVDPGERQAVLAELVQMDLEYRMKAGRPARVEEYWNRFPELVARREAAVSLVAAEIALRKRYAPDA